MNIVVLGGIGVTLVGLLGLLVGATHHNIQERILFLFACIGMAVTFQFQHLTQAPPDIAFRFDAFTHFAGAAIFGTCAVTLFVLKFSKHFNPLGAQIAFCTLGLILLIRNYAREGHGLFYKSIEYNSEMQSSLYGTIHIYNRELSDHSILAYGFILVGLSWASTSFLACIKTLRKEHGRGYLSILLFGSYFVALQITATHDVLIDHGFVDPPYLSGLVNIWLVIAAAIGIVQTQYAFSSKLRAQAEELIAQNALKDETNQRLNSIAMYDQDTQLLSTYGFSCLYPEFKVQQPEKDITCHALKIANYTYYASQSADFANQAVKQLANRICNEQFGDSLITRLGVDEILVTQFNKRGETQKAIQALKSLVERPIVIMGYSASPTIELGGVTACSREWGPLDVIHYARSALEHAQGHSSEKLFYLDESGIKVVNEDQQLAMELESAISQQKISFFIQPQHDASGRPVGGEVLARWIHEELGFISPDRFIALAERRGLINQLGYSILENAIALMADHREAFGQSRLAVNISAWQLRDPEFCDKVFSLLKKHDVKGSQLELEITESAVLEDIESTREILKLLKSEDIEVSLDDFGTGYSSLSQLFAIPISTLKVDRSFIGEVRNGQFAQHQVLLTSIYKIAKSLDLETVVEGVETKEQLEALKEIGYNQFQGYYFNRPLPPKDFLRLRSEHTSGEKPKSQVVQFPKK